MKIKILVIDNELPIRRAFVKMLQHICDSRYDIHESDSVRNGIVMMHELCPQVLFLDIELDDGTGFDFLNQVDYTQTQIIFTTAHNQYAIKAFEYSAVNYLLKPISPSALLKALTDATERIEKNDLANQMQVMFQSLRNEQKADQKIVLKDINGVYFVKVTDIVYCEASGAYTIFVLSDDRKIVVSKNLKEYEHLLTEYLFARSHHGFLVNLTKVKSIDKSDGNTLLLEGNHKIPVSFRKKEEIIHKMKELIR